MSERLRTREIDDDEGRQLVRIVRRMLQSTVRIPARPRIMNLTRVGLVAEIHDQVAHLLGSPCAPRCALPYPRFSREELGGRFPGLMAYPILKGGWERACQLTRGRVQVSGTVFGGPA